MEEIMADILRRINELEVLVEQFPKGSIGKKTVNDRLYYYLRYTENKKKKEKYIPYDRLEALQKQLARRDELQSELDGLYTVREKETRYQTAAGSEIFRTEVLTGAALYEFAEPVKNLKKRDCFKELEAYLNHPHIEKVLILYGLRRTGKTTLARQAILNMDEETFSRTAYMHIRKGRTLADINFDLKELQARGYKYIFIDEVTLLDEFIEGGSLLSDIYAASGIKIVLSGTDSLGFLFARADELYDRCILIHTTFIPYREFERVLDVKGVDEYIRYGGTMSVSGKDYMSQSPFISSISASDYTDSAIAHNIQHSLKYYQYGGHFRALQDLYDHDELTSAINRVVEDMNHRFTVEVLTKDFRSSDLSLAAKNLRKDKNEPNVILDQIESDRVTDRLIELLEIKNKENQITDIKEYHEIEIKEYLDRLDLTVDIDIITLPSGKKIKRTLITQPGFRYCQADALITALEEDEQVKNLSAGERNKIINRIRTTIIGRILEDMILLETLKARPDKKVCKVQFSEGEFDMLVYDPHTVTCKIFEIKHSSQHTPRQYRYLTDEDLLEKTEFAFGRITERTVLYNGETFEENGIHYQNIREYLNSL